MKPTESCQEYSQILNNIAHCAPRKIAQVKADRVLCMMKKCPHRRYSLSSVDHRHYQEMDE